MIRGITFSEQTFYSKDFAHYMNFFLNGGCGITKGCSITQDGTKVTIGTGYFVAHGRLMNVEEAEVVDATKGFESGYNRIVYEIDLSKENTIIDFKQGYIKVLQTESLTQEDLDGTGTVYQFPLCHFQWSGAAITSFTIDAPTLVLENIFADISDNFDTVNAQFDAWFTAQKTSVTNQLNQEISDTEAWVQQQKQVVNNLIESLETGGFAKTETYTAEIGTSWTAEGSVFKQAVTVSGILATDNPTIDLVTTTAGFETEQEEFAKIFKAVTSANTITFYASESTANAINVQIKVVR